MDAILSLITLMIIGWLAYGPWQHACTDFARQKIFRNRDRLFDIAAAGRISFDSNIYQSIRVSLEQNIRFAHMLTLPRLVTYRYLMRDRFVGESEASKTIDKIEDEKLKAEVRWLVKDSQVVLLTMTLMKSPLFFFLLPVYLAIYLNHRIASMAYKFVAGRIGRLGELVQLEAEHAAI